MFKKQVTPHPPVPTASTWVAAPPPSQQRPGSFSRGESKTEGRECESSHGCLSRVGSLGSLLSGIWLWLQSLRLDALGEALPRWLRGFPSTRPLHRIRVLKAGQLASPRVNHLKDHCRSNYAFPNLTYPSLGNHMSYHRVIEHTGQPCVSVGRGPHEDAIPGGRDHRSQLGGWLPTPKAFL